MNRIFSRWLFVLLLVPGLVHAQAQQVSSIQRAIGSLIQSKAIKRGFAANDPRISSTMVATGSTVAGLAASAAVVTAAGITAPAWVAAAVVMGLGALFSAGISIAVDYAVKWYFNSDGSISDAAIDPKDSDASAMVEGGSYYQFDNYSAGDLATALRAGMSCENGRYCNNQWNTYEAHSCYVTGGSVDCRIQVCSPTSGTCSQTDPDYMASYRGSYGSQGAPASCPAGQVWDRGNPGCIVPSKGAAVPTWSGEKSK